MNFEQWKLNLEARWQAFKAGIEAQQNSFFPSDEEIVEIDDEETAKVFDKNEHWGYPHLSCPICGMNDAHVVSAYGRTGVDKAESGKGYLGVETRGRTNDRRDALSIGVEGECGHNFNIVFQQHKGTEFLYVEVLKKDLDEYKELEKIREDIVRRPRIKKNTAF
jgi:hypothetical protein